jgi:hypothetical protein
VCPTEICLVTFQSLQYSDTIVEVIVVFQRSLLDVRGVYFDVLSCGQSVRSLHYCCLLLLLRLLWVIPNLSHPICYHDMQIKVVFVAIHDCDKRNGTTQNDRASTPYYPKLPSYIVKIDLSTRSTSLHPVQQEKEGVVQYLFWISCFAKFTSYVRKWL